MKWLESELMRLRALEPEDLDKLYVWENDAALWEYGSTLVPYSRHVLKNYLAVSSPDIYIQRQLRLMIELKSIKEAVGAADLYEFDPHHRRAGVGILVDTAHQHKGIAKGALMLLINYAFEFLNLHQLYAYIPLSNDPSHKLFQSCGFQSCGILRDWVHTSRGFTDVEFLNLINVKD